MASDYSLRRRAMQLAAQLPDNINEARRILEHMRRLLDYDDTPETEKIPRLAHVE